MQMHKPVLTLAPDLKSNLQREEVILYADGLLAGQIISGLLKKNIITILRLLDKREVKSNYYHLLDKKELLQTSFFWGEFLEEKYNEKSNLHFWSIFLQYALGSEGIKFSNRFPTIFSILRLKKLFLEKAERRLLASATLYTSTEKEPPAPEDVRFEILRFPKEQYLLISLNDNLYEILSFFLTKCSSTKKAVLVKLLTDAGYSKNIAKSIIEKSKVLVEGLEKFIETKSSRDTKSTTSIPHISQEITYYSFWYKECLKRKFYLDYIENKENVRDAVPFILKAMHEVFLNHAEKCKKQCAACVFEKSSNSLEDIFNTNLSLKCEKSFCQVKDFLILEIYEAFYSEKNKKEISAHLEKIISSYIFLLPDIFLPHTATSIFNYYKSFKVLPYSTVQEDSLIGHELQSNNEYIEFNDKVVFKKSLDEKLKYCSEMMKDGKQRIDNTSFIIGMYIWDEIHILKNKDSVLKISANIATSEIKELLEEKFPSEDGNLKQMQDYCNKCYIRVRESIANENCKLLSTEDALNRNSARKNSSNDL